MSETGSSLSVLSGLLDSLGSALKSHIMSDLNAWEDRRRSEAQTSRGKKSAHKRPRLQPMPELSPHTLADMRRMRHALYGCQTDQRDTVGAVAAWAIGVLALSVSLADMKGNFNLNDLLSLPSTKAAFHLLLLAIETSFTYQPVEDAEAAFIDRVLATTNDPRAVGWVLSQYGCVHSMTFPRCLQIYAIARLAKPQAAGLEASGLAQAVSDLNSAHPENATRVLDGILSIYCSTVAEVEGNPAMLSDIPIDDSRRYILFYLLQAASRQSKSGPLLLSTGEHQRWLASAIKFEMRLGFSQFHHLSGDDSVVALHPLADAVDVLYVDMLAGRPKKPSDQPLDIDRALDAFALIGAVVRGHRSDLAGDVDMDDSDLVSFVDLCHSCLVRLLSREQTIIVLTHMPRTVKNMPQPIPNGLQEAVQKGGRSYNNGPIALPPVEQAELDALSRKLLDVMASAADLASPIAEDSQDQSKASSPAADRLYEMVCDTAPMLIEVLVSRMADTPDAAKVLVRRLVDTWSISRSNEPADSRSVRARYRALLAISESTSSSSTTNTDESQLNAVFEISDDDERDRCISKEAKFGDQAHCGDSAVGLDELLEGAELPRAGSRAMRGEVSLAKAEHFIWQNAVRPMPRYPRSGMRDYDRTKDARAFVRATSNKPIIAEASCGLDLARPLLAFGLLSLAHVTPVGIPTLCELLEEYYVDCLPSMPPALLDERLNSGARLQLRAIEMEFLQDTKETPDLELLVLELIRIPSGANAAKRMVSALLASLVVLWNGALGQPTSKRASDLAFTTRFVAHVLEAYGGDERSRQVCRLFPLISGGDLARLLHQYVWRWIVYRMPGAQDESHKLLLHIMRRYVVVAAPLFKHFVVDA
ncbi:hypothetical protein H4R26_004436 [Coemansia thaxteri]|uniref:Uncharacterized protein n=1 Tax=Coemansia thaxteri TaxID=2663907 RepID=A0A9W8EE11_9FUNG|nr:hypothetical protein H4R26_004436 [Coemansia thaxteri]